MLFYSKKTEYAVQIMVVIGKQDNGSDYVSLETIRHTADVPKVAPMMSTVIIKANAPPSDVARVTIIDTPTMVMAAQMKPVANTRLILFMIQPPVVHPTSVRKYMGIRKMEASSCINVIPTPSRVG